MSRVLPLAVLAAVVLATIALASGPVAAAGTVEDPDCENAGMDMDGPFEHIVGLGPFGSDVECQGGGGGTFGTCPLPTEFGSNVGSTCK